jgi:hypothetical protein
MHYGSRGYAGPRPAAVLARLLGIRITVAVASSHEGDLAGMTGDRQDMLVAVKRTPPANRISLHPTPGWLTTFLEAGVDLLAYDGAPCSEAAGPLADAVRRRPAPRSQP